MPLYSNPNRYNVFLSVYLKGARVGIENAIYTRFIQAANLNATAAGTD